MNGRQQIAMFAKNRQMTITAIIKSLPKNSNLPLMVVPHFLWSMMLSDKLQQGKSINVHQLKAEEHMQFTCWPCSWATHDAASSQHKSFLDWQQQQQRLLVLLHSTRCHSAACTGVLSVPAPPHWESLCHLDQPAHTHRQLNTASDISTLRQTTRAAYQQQTQKYSLLVHVQIWVLALEAGIKAVESLPSEANSRLQDDAVFFKVRYWPKLHDSRSSKWHRTTADKLS